MLGHGLIIIGLMKNYHRRIGTVALSVVLASGCASTWRGSGSVSTGASTAPSTATARRDTHEGLNDVLWMQTLAEFWALTTASYNGAQVLLERALSDKSWSAALEQAAGSENLPPAVILDLDETVLDNSPAQAQVALERTVYQQDLWSAWVEKMAAAAIPGAQSFIGFAESAASRFFSSQTGALPSKLPR